MTAEPQSAPEPRAQDAAAEHAPPRGFITPVIAVANAVLALALLGELGAVFANVIARTFFDIAFLWTDEVAKLALSTLAFVGGAVAYASGHHTYVRVLLKAMGLRGERLCIAASDILVLLIAVVTGVSSLSLLQTRWDELTPILQMPASFIVAPLAASMALLALAAIDRLARQHRPTVIVAAAMLVPLLALAAATRPLWIPLFAGDGAIAAALVLFFVTIFCALPIGFALVLSTTAYLWTADTVSMVALPQNMVDGTGNFVLLALPFFILAGLVMERGGISLRLVQLVQALVGHFRGGLLHVMVMSMYLVSGLSG
jgi:TRAP-type C4-dicarboxylate transport system permease small subunit